MNDDKIRFEAMVRKLREKKYKITPQRLAILKILSTSAGHPSVEKIYERLKNDFPTMSLATVYKNISIVKDIGEVLELSFGDESNRYDGNNPSPHPHVICTRCKKIIDPELEGLKDFSDEIVRKTGFWVSSHRIDFFGLCPDCQNSEG